MPNRMKKYDSYKDSGVKWLGEIPSHWNVTKLKYIGNAIGGLTYTPNDIVEDETKGKLVLRSSNIQDGKLSLVDNVYVKSDISEKLTLKKGDILICSRNGSQHLIGKNICIDESKTNVGYEINFTKYFYQYKALRSLEEIRQDMLAIEQETDGLLKEII
ncbi:MAG: hypothetical protein HYU67_10690 [Flavobacteriia bacterium]|nr:hypothetical protein [Flavobacteriia bacterium]